MRNSIFDVLPVIFGMVFSVVGGGIIGRALVDLISTARSDASPSSSRVVFGLFQLIFGGIFVFQSTRIGKFTDTPWLLPVQIVIVLVVLAGALRIRVPPVFNDIHLPQLAPIVGGAILFIVGLGWAGQLFKQGKINDAIFVGAIGGVIGMVVLAFSLWRIMQEDSTAQS